MIHPVTWFKSKTEPCGLAVEWRFEEIVSFVRNVSARTDKLALPLWSPVSFVGNRRALANVKSVSMFVYDVDEPQGDVSAFAGRVDAAFAGARTLVHSSFSSEVGAWKMRVIVPLARCITREEHDLAWHVGDWLLHAKGIEVDGACKDASRGYFVPADPPNSSYRWRLSMGADEPCSVDAYIRRARVVRAEEEARAAAEREEARRRFAERSRFNGSVESRARAYLRSVPGAVEGQHGHDATFVVALKLVHGFGLDESTALSLLSAWNETCSPPWSAKDLERKVAQAVQHGRAEPGFMLDNERRRG